MIDRETAKNMVLNYFIPDEHMMGRGDEYAIRDEDTVETSYGWIFHCNSRLYFETKNPKFAVYGIGSVVVEKQDGSVHLLGTGYNP